MEEGEVGGVREAGAENAVVDHGEVERRYVGLFSGEFIDGGRYRQFLAVVDVGYVGGGDDFDRPAHLFFLPLLFYCH